MSLINIPKSRSFLLNSKSRSAGFLNFVSVMIEDFGGTSSLQLSICSERNLLKRSCADVHDYDEWRSIHENIDTFSQT